MRHNEIMPFASVPDALEELRSGRMLVVVDDEDRENEGDLTIAAQLVTPEAINFMATYGRGLICLALAPEHCDRLSIPLMSRHNTSRFHTAFCEAIDASEGVTTGISAADRAHTIQVAMRQDAKPSDLARPGHVFPLRAREGGVLVRAGQTEAAVDLARLAGLAPGGVICEIMNPDGTMSRLPELEEFARVHDMKIISVADLVRYRMRKEVLVRRATETDLPTVYGRLRAVAFENVMNGEVHLAMVMGEVRTDDPVLVRVHTENVTCDMFGSLIGDSGFQLHTALEKIAAAGRGVVLYLRQRQHGLDLVHQLRTYALMQERGISLQEASVATGYGADRDYGVGAQILHELGLRRILLLTNHPPKVSALEGFGLEIVGNEPLGSPARENGEEKNERRTMNIGRKGKDS